MVEALGAMHYLWGCTQLQVLNIVCCKVLNHLLGDAGECCMVCCDLMDDPKHLEDLTEGTVSCTLFSSHCCQLLFKPSLCYQEGPCVTFFKHLCQ